VNIPNSSRQGIAQGTIQSKEITISTSDTVPVLISLDEIIEKNHSMVETPWRRDSKLESGRRCRIRTDIR